MSLVNRFSTLQSVPCIQILLVFEAHHAALLLVDEVEPVVGTGGHAGDRAALQAAVEHAEMLAGRLEGMNTTDLVVGHVQGARGPSPWALPLGRYQLFVMPKRLIF